MHFNGFELIKLNWEIQDYSAADSNWRFACAECAQWKIILKNYVNLTNYDFLE